MPRHVYKVATVAQWQAAEAAGVFTGAPVDLADGFIHFSTAAQLVGTLERHFPRQPALLLLTVDTEGLGALRWEPSRGGQLFPHLYAPLPLAAVVAVEPLALGADGRHAVPPLEPDPP